MLAVPTYLVVGQSVDLRHLDGEPRAVREGLVDGHELSLLSSCGSKGEDEGILRQDRQSDVEE